MGVIRDRCGYNAKQLILDEKLSPFEALKILREHFSKGGAGEFARVSTLWNLITMDGAKGIGHYRSEIRRLWNRFAEIDSSLKIPEPHAVQKFIAGLPESFEPFVTSFNQNNKLIPKTENNRTVTNAVSLGEAMYAMLGTRLDIAYLVSVVSRFCANPTEAH
ncbi:unnamed protein product [Zymoseptoria tritici ST99CH_3D1]|nr:unnamed protein product [Zymoseptoria tritici ST99CH_3D1]